MHVLKAIASPGKMETEPPPDDIGVTGTLFAMKDVFVIKTGEERIVFTIESAPPAVPAPLRSKREFVISSKRAFFIFESKYGIPIATAPHIHTIFPRNMQFVRVPKHV